MDKSAATPVLWSKGFTYLLGVSVVNAIAFGTVNPIFPGFLVGLGATLTVAGLITGIFSYVALAGRPLASILGDRGNKKKMLMIFMTAHGLFTLLYAFAPDIAWVVPFRVARGLAFSVAGTISLALGTDYIPKARMGEGVGFLGVGQIIGMALGPNIGIFLLGVFNDNYPPIFMIAGATIMVAGLSVAFLKYSRPVDDENAPRQKFSFKEMVAVELLPISLFASIFAIGNGLVVSFLVMMGQERNIANFGLYFIINAVVILLIRPMAGRLTDRRGVAFVVLPGFIFAAAAMVTLGLAAATWHVILAALFVAFGGGIALPALQTSCIQRLGPARRTVAMGTFLIGMDIGMGGGPIIGGAIADATSFAVAFYSAAGLALVGFGAYFVYSAARRRGQVAAEISENVNVS